MTLEDTGLGFSLGLIDGKWHASCHICGRVLVRSRDRVGLLLAANHHVERRH